MSSYMLSHGDLNPQSPATKLSQARQLRGTEIWTKTTSTILTHIANCCETTGKHTSPFRWFFCHPATVTSAFCLLADGVVPGKSLYFQNVSIFPKRSQDHLIWFCSCSVSSLEVFSSAPVSKTNHDQSEVFWRGKRHSSLWRRFFQTREVVWSWKRCSVEQNLSLKPARWSWKRLVVYNCSTQNLPKRHARHVNHVWNDRSWSARSATEPMCAELAETKVWFLNVRLATLKICQNSP